MKNILLTLLLAFTFIAQSKGQTTGIQSEYRHFVGTSPLSIFNLFPEPADFYELNYGYRLSAKDEIVIRALTWKYNEPLGIPFGPSFESPDERYPGYVRAWGIGLGYKHYTWKKLFIAAYATPFLQNFKTLENEKIQSGFQLFLQAQLGYHFEFFNGRFYIEPAIESNYWPVNTNFPESFKNFEDRWPNYFILEPFLTVGYSF